MLEKVKELWVKISKKDKTLVLGSILFGIGVTIGFNKGYNRGVVTGALGERAVVAEELFKGFLDSIDNK